MKKIALSLAVFALLLLPLSVKAAEFVTDKSGNVSVAKTETPKNLYTAGANVTVDANVRKDLVAVGSVINVNGTVADNLVVMGGTIDIINSVGGNAYIGGGNVTINNVIGEDLVVGGGNIVIGASAEIKGDLLVAGGTVDIKGKVLGDVKVAGGTITISGNITGDVTSYDNQSLTITKTAIVGGKLTYSSPNTATIDSSAKIAGGTEYKQISGKNLRSARYMEFWKTIIFGIFGTLITLLAFIYFLPKTATRVVTESYVNYWHNILLGLGALIITPIIIFVLLALTITSSLAAILGLIYILALIAACFTGTLLIGVGLMKWLNRGVKGFQIDWLAILVGVVAVALLGQIPFLGPLVIFIFFIVALGTLFDIARNKVKSSR